ncbi:MAG: hypothetical protein ABEH83_08475 [Halobacterium sp.]
MRVPGHTTAFAVLIVVASAATGASAALQQPQSSADGAARAGAADAPTVTERVVVTRKNETAAVVEYEYRIPDGVDSLEIVHYDGSGTYAPPAITGLEVRTDTPHKTQYEYERDSGGTATATLRFVVSLDTDSLRDGEAGVAGDGWQYVKLPSVVVQRTGADRIPAVDRTQRVAGTSGYATSQAAFVGEFDESTVSADGQTFHLLVPAAAELGPPRTAVLDSLTHAAEAFPDVDDDPHVYALALPGHVATEVSGAASDSSFWVRADNWPGSPENTWVHEYVHTQQTGSAAADSAWLTEASAEYYAAVLHARRAGDATAARQHVASVDHPDAVLTAQDSGDGVNAEYGKGARVYAALDARIRNATDGSASAMDVFRDVYSAGGYVRTHEVRGRVADYLGEEDTDRFFDRFVDGASVPEMPEQHVLTLGPERDADGDGVPNWEEAQQAESPYGDAEQTDLADAPQLTTTQAVVSLALVGSGLFALAVSGTVGAARVLDRLIGWSPRRLRDRSLLRWLAFAVVSLAASLAYAMSVMG